MAFNVIVDNKDLGTIKPGMAVSAIDYFEPGPILNYYQAKYGCNVGHDGAEKNGQNEITNYIQSWPGFGMVHVIDTR